MPTFDTPEPISVTLDLGVGDVRITASDRADTVVEVRPSDAADEPTCRPPSRPGSTTPTAGCWSRAPKRSASASSAEPGRSTCRSSCRPVPGVGGDVPMGDFRGDGRLGECRLKTSAGDVRLERDRARCDLRHRRRRRSRSDRVDRRRRDLHRLRRDPARRGRRHRGGQELQRRHLDRRGHRRPAGAARPTATSPSSARRRRRRRQDRQRRRPVGEVGPRLGRRSRPPCGELEVGIARGHRRLARRCNTSFGNVRNRLETPPRPGRRPSETVEVRARTSFGDIIIRRA